MTVEEIEGRMSMGLNSARRQLVQPLQQQQQAQALLQAGFGGVPVGTPAGLQQSALYAGQPALAGQAGLIQNQRLAGVRLFVAFPWHLCLYRWSRLSNSPDCRNCAI